MQPPLSTFWVGGCPVRHGLFVVENLYPCLFDDCAEGRSNCLQLLSIHLKVRIVLGGLNCDSQSPVFDQCPHPAETSTSSKPHLPRGWPLSHHPRHRIEIVPIEPAVFLHGSPR